MLAARRATQDDVQRLKRDVEQLRLGIERGLRPAEDAGFHIDVVRATHNSSLLRLSTAIMDFYEHDDNAPTPADLHDHQSICQAIVRRRRGCGTRANAPAPGDCEQQKWSARPRREQASRHEQDGAAQRGGRGAVTQSSASAWEARLVELGIVLPVARRIAGRKLCARRSHRLVTIRLRPDVEGRRSNVRTRSCAHRGILSIAPESRLATARSHVSLRFEPWQVRWTP